MIGRAVNVELLILNHRISKTITRAIVLQFAHLENKSGLKSEPMSDQAAV
jgi:hypothetical protein